MQTTTAELNNPQILLNTNNLWSVKGHMKLVVFLVRANTAAENALFSNAIQTPCSLQWKEFSGRALYTKYLQPNCYFRWDEPLLNIDNSKIDVWNGHVACFNWRLWIKAVNQTLSVHEETGTLQAGYRQRYNWLHGKACFALAPSNQSFYCTVEQISI